MEFLDREDELETLNQAYDEGGFIPVYGRRRVGKTELIQQFLNDRNGVYYLAAQEAPSQQVKEFKELIAEEVNDSYLRDSGIDSWKELFSYLENNLDPDRKMCLVIDEVTYIIRRNDSFPSYVQKFWDEFLKDSELSLVLSGSLIGLMKESILNYSSPLYGRRTGQINLDPLDLDYLAPLFSDFEKSLKIYSLLGGVPKYYEQIENEKDFHSIVDSMLNPDSFFYEEGLFLLSQEFKKLGQYNSILRSISQGNHKATDIANYAGIDTRQVYAYLDKLYEIGFVGKEQPVTEGSEKRRNHRYYIEDNFTRFWFKVIFPERSRIQSGEIDHGYFEKKIKDLEARSFEEICREAIRETGRYQKTGRWWYKEDEIDIVALNEKDEELLLGEAKWTNQKVGTGLLRKLEQKKEKVRWKNQSSRTEKYALFSKNGFTEDLREEASRRDDLELYELERLSEIFSYG